MTDSDKNPDFSAAGLKTVRLKFADGWAGHVVLSDSLGKSLSPKDWLECLSDPEELLTQPERIIKSDGKSIVVVKELKISNKNLTVVVKSESISGGLKGFCRSFLPAKAFRNFNTAIKLHNNDIPVVTPLAALQRKKGLSTVRSVYITEYTQNSTDLQTFLRRNMSLFRQYELTLKKSFCLQIASIFTSLHKVSLWHRDAKGGNFLVYSAERNSQPKYTIALLDMDGIKPYYLRCRSLRFRCLSKLAATVLWHPLLNRTDYLRTFMIYCNLSGIGVSKRRQLFRRLALRAVATRLLTMATSAMESIKRD